MHKRKIFKKKEKPPKIENLSQEDKKSNEEQSEQNGDVEMKDENEVKLSEQSTKEQTKEEEEKKENEEEKVKEKVEEKEEKKEVEKEEEKEVEKEEEKPQIDELSSSEEEECGEIEVEEFFVKYKSISYLHSEWRTRDELFQTDKRIDQKIKRFKQKKSQATNYGDEDAVGVESEDELFNPDYVEIDRILDTYTVSDPNNLNGEKLTYYLVKWKVLAYEEATWELEQDLNKKKIERFHEINTPPTDTKVVPKPRLDRWTKMKQSRTYKNGNTLREYQLEGINWLTYCWLQGRNCILADEMGLGKTVQSITFLQEVANYGVNGPFLVIVPLSTIGNWIREFETWTNFNVIVYHGSSISRNLIQDYEFYYKDHLNTKNLKNYPKFNALITTFEVLLSDVQLFAQLKWRNLIIDEAHRLKNKNCKLIEGLRFVEFEHKVLLTGTPLQNNVEELFSLLNYLEPDQFNSSQEFLQEFGDLKTDTQVSKLQAILKPMMLRRLKEDVEKSLAPKEETIIEVELTNTQKKYYRAILEKNFQFLSRGATSSNVPNLMNTMMELRKCCNHPYLINGTYLIVVNIIFKLPFLIFLYH
jgi:chromodomain-helicase-DNA-binding protein 7